MTDGIAIWVQYAFRDCPGAGPIPVWFRADVEADVLRRVDILGGDVADHVLKRVRAELSWKRVAEDDAEHRKAGQNCGELHDWRRDTVPSVIRD